jgi:predicted murein hydrolase (TIGR00659 family)
MMAYIWWSLPLTLAVFFAARKLSARFKMALLNPLLIAMVVIIPFLLVTGIPYDHYFQGSKILNDLLQPAVVALAFPLYEQLHQIRARWKSIITICFFGSIVAMASGAGIALMMGASPEIAASILPKSVTTPIAMAVGGSIGGIPAISAVCVIFVGVLGAVFGHTCWMPCVFAQNQLAAWRWAPHLTPWVPRVVQSWIIRKARSAHWHWLFVGLLRH